MFPFPKKLLTPISSSGRLLTFEILRKQLAQVIALANTPINPNISARDQLRRPQSQLPDLRADISSNLQQAKHLKAIQ
jgi:hypothetical protein